MWWAFHGFYYVMPIAFSFLPPFLSECSFDQSFSLGCLVAENVLKSSSHSVMTLFLREIINATHTRLHTNEIKMSNFDNPERKVKNTLLLMLYTFVLHNSRIIFHWCIFSYISPLLMCRSVRIFSFQLEYDLYCTFNAFR